MLLYKNVGIGSLVFSKFWHGARNAYEVVCGRAGYFGKNLPKKLGKRAKNSFF